jgi:hypothetical protein
MSDQQWCHSGILPHVAVGLAPRGYRTLSRSGNPDHLPLDEDHPLVERILQLRA